MFINQTNIFPNFTNIASTTLCNDTWLNHTVKNLNLEPFTNVTKLSYIFSTFYSKQDAPPSLPENYMYLLGKGVAVSFVMGLLQHRLMRTIFND